MMLNFCSMGREARNEVEMDEGDTSHSRIQKKVAFHTARGK
jgi:hypothetical protein